MVSYMCKAASGRLYPSLGAVRYLLKSSYSFPQKKYNNPNLFTRLLFDPQSGAVMAVLAAVCTKVPEAKLGIIFLPMITFTAGNVSDEQYVCVHGDCCVCVCMCVMYCMESFSCHVDTHL